MRIENIYLTIDNFEKALISWIDLHVISAATGNGHLWLRGAIGLPGQQVCGRRRLATIPRSTRLATGRGQLEEGLEDFSMVEIRVL
jgi:hypothetical protein